MKAAYLEKRRRERGRPQPSAERPAASPDLRHVPHDHWDEEPAGADRGYVPYTGSASRHSASSR